MVMAFYSSSHLTNPEAHISPACESGCHFKVKPSDVFKDFKEYANTHFLMYLCMYLFVKEVYVRHVCQF